MKTPTRILNCCEDLQLDIEDYQKITIKGNTIRFAGSIINYCPFCGKKLQIITPQLQNKVAKEEYGESFGKLATMEQRYVIMKISEQIYCQKEVKK